MFEQIRKAISKSNVGEMKEIIRLQKSMDSFDKSIESARNAVSKAMNDGKTSAKMKYIAEALNISDNSIKPTNKKVTINDDMTNKRPESVTFMGKTVEAKSWRAVSEVVLNMLYDKDRTVFSNFIKAGDQGRVAYIARSSDGMRAPIMLGSGRGAIYADVSRITNNDFLFLKKLMDVAGVEQNQLIINLDPTFYRKPVVRRKKGSSVEENKPKRRGRPKKAV